MPTIKPEDVIATVFQNFWNQERMVAVQQLCSKENLKPEAVNQMIANYKFTGKEPLRDTVLNTCNEKPKLLERKKSSIVLYRNSSTLSTNSMTLLAHLQMIQMHTAFPVNN
jgi:type I site-specific restriction-modification system R (restriction) subunit